MPPTLRPRKRHSAETPATAVSSPQEPSSTATAVSSNSSNLTKRTPRSTRNEKRPEDEMTMPDEERPLLGSPAPPHEVSEENRTWAQRNQWIVFALASGACAAFNGVFAKLTTTELTASFSSWIARILGLENVERVIEFVVRGSFFGLNLAFNGVMWTLFTTALARGNSTTQVSIMNTSTNFVITALLGYVIFSEALPPLWWLGAAMLVAGNVIIGRKDEGLPKEEGQEERIINGEGHAREGDALISEPGGEAEQRSDGPANGPARQDEEDEEKEEDEDVADLRI